MKIGKITSAFIAIAVVTVGLLSSCGIDRQAKELRAFEKCQYEIVAADNVFLAGTDISALISKGTVDLSDLPGIAISFLTQDMPLSGDLQVRITNPTSQLAGINQFIYQIQIEGKDFIEGISESPISVPAHSTTIVPVRIDANMFNILKDRQTLQKVMDFIQQNPDNEDKSIQLTLRLKPTLAIGNKEINYPGFITVNKKIDRSILTF